MYDSWQGTGRWMRACVAVIAMAAVGAGTAAPLSAATTTTTFQVLATVAGVCSVTAVDLNFGAYDAIVAHASTPNDAAGSVDMACTTGVTAAIGLDLGANATGSTRRMLKTGGGGLLTYEIYSNSARTTVWGNDAATDLDPVVAPSTAVRSFSTYGRMPAAQDVPIGSYVDTITVTVTY